MLRARVELTQRIREIEFTELVKRRMIEEIKDQVESVQRTSARSSTSSASSNRRRAGSR